MYLVDGLFCFISFLRHLERSLTKSKDPSSIRAAKRHYIFLSSSMNDSCLKTGRKRRLPGEKGRIQKLEIDTEASSCTAVAPSQGSTTPSGVCGGHEASVEPSALNDASFEAVLRTLVRCSTR